MPQDFFETPKEEGAEETPKVKVGEKEFSQEELDRLVSLGEKAAEVEKNHGSFDKFVSDYGRTKEDIGKYKRQVEEMESKMKEAPQAPSELSAEQVALAKQQLNMLLGGEPITQGNFARMYVAMRDGEKLLEECDDLAKEINGTDGRPKFDREEMINYMSETGIKKPLLAYKDKYEKELDAWGTSQLTKKPEGMSTLSPSGGGSKEPVQPKVTRDNLTQMISEAMYGSQEE